MGLRTNTACPVAEESVLVSSIMIPSLSRLATDTSAAADVLVDIFSVKRLPHL
jgi:hypothetical protein